MPAAIALATAAAALGLDDDLPPLVEALGRVDLIGEPAVWDDPGVDWAGYDLVVLRSTWDYPPRRDQFLAWVDEVAAATPVLNPPEVVRWNSDKHYLAELAAAGLAVVETSFVEPGDRFEPPPYEHVVKPAISAGALNTGRYRGDGARPLVERLLAEGRSVMVQPYLSAVDESGERGLVHIEGEYSHAFTKGPLLRPGGEMPDGLFAEEDISPATATDTERSVAAEVHRWVEARFGRLLYERVDLIAGGSGRPVVLELELAEPSLYHATHPASADHLAAAIKRRLETDPAGVGPAA